MYENIVTDYILFKIVFGYFNMYNRAKFSQFEGLIRALTTKNSKFLQNNLNVWMVVFFLFEQHCHPQSTATKIASTRNETNVSY